MTKEEADFISGMNMCDEISNEAYRKIMCHCEEQEPCEDAVSRQAVLDLVNSDWKYEGLETDVASLPSVNPQEPKCETAKWIRRSGIMSWKWFECDRCTTGYDFATPYCPHCGARMGGAE